MNAFVKAFEKTIFKFIKKYGIEVALGMMAFLYVVFNIKSEVKKRKLNLLTTIEELQQKRAELEEELRLSTEHERQEVIKKLIEYCDRRIATIQKEKDKNVA